MENISDFYPAMFQCAVSVVRMLIAIAFSVIIIPWVKKSAIPWLKEKHLYGIITKFVRAAEKLGESGTIDKSAKLDYVMALLAKRNITVDAEVRAMIESAVGDLDDEISQGMAALTEALNSAGEDVNIFYGDHTATVSGTGTVEFDEEEHDDDTDEVSDEEPSRAPAEIPEELLL